MEMEIVITIPPRFVPSAEEKGLVENATGRIQQINNLQQNQNQEYRK